MYIAWWLQCVDCLCAYMDTYHGGSVTVTYTLWVLLLFLCVTVNKEILDCSSDVFSLGEKHFYCYFVSVIRSCYSPISKGGQAKRRWQNRYHVPETQNTQHSLARRCVTGRFALQLCLRRSCRFLAGAHSPAPSPIHVIYV